MPWVRLDEQFPDHPKVVTAGPLCGWLHVCALAYCNRLLTDGFIPAAQVTRLADFSDVWGPDGAADFGIDPFDLAKKLCDVGMWKPVKGGYLIHDYHDYQPSRHDEHEKRRQKAEAGAKGGRASGETRRGSRNEADGKQTGSTSEAPCFDSASRSVEAKPNPDPTRTDTDLVSQHLGARSQSKSLSLVPSSPPSPSAPARGSRLPNGFRATEEMHAWAERETPVVAVVSETERFCDYWRGVPGAKGRKLDWEATWRNWMRKAGEYAQPRTNGNTPAARSEVAMLAWLATEEARA